jgi:hypothetical protein
VIAHVVLFTPRVELAPEARAALAAALETALRDIPTIRRVRVGPRVTHGRPGYEQLMRVDYQYAAILEFDDEAGLQAYLAHPAHERLGEQFFATFEHALMYDFDLQDGAGAVRALAQRVAT